jgi:hypothetical protein
VATSSQDAWTHQVLERLTIIKLALQRLRRQPELCHPQEGPLDQALVQTEALVSAVRQGRDQDGSDRPD